MILGDASVREGGWEAGREGRGEFYKIIWFHQLSW